MAKWPLFCVILPNLVVSGAHCVKLIDKAITVNNLRLLCLVVNVCRGTARRPLCKYSITAKWKFGRRFINSRLNMQYLPSYRSKPCFWYFEVRVRYRRKKFTFAISSPDEFSSACFRRESSPPVSLMLDICLFFYYT